MSTIDTELVQCDNNNLYHIDWGNGIEKYTRKMKNKKNMNVVHVNKYVAHSIYGNICSTFINWENGKIQISMITNKICFFSHFVIIIVFDTSTPAPTSVLKGFFCNFLRICHDCHLLEEASRTTVAIIKNHRTFYGFPIEKSIRCPTDRIMHDEYTLLSVSFGETIIKRHSKI